MYRYEAHIWEKAEHWAFEEYIDADSEEAAWKELTKMFPSRRYSIRHVRRVYKPQT